MSPEKIKLRLRLLRGTRPAWEVAAACDITDGALYNYENGSRIPADEVKERLARYYGVSVQELFYDD